MLSSLALLVPMEAAICMRLTVKLCMCRGTYCFMTPETVMLESEGGVQDDIRALAATMFHLMTGTDVHDVLDAQYKLLPEAVKERLEARCRKISKTPDHGLLLAAAELEEEIAVVQVCCAFCMTCLCL